MNVGPVSQTVVRREANFGSASLHLAPASSIILSAQLRAGNRLDLYLLNLPHSSNVIDHVEYCLFIFCLILRHNIYLY